MPSSITADACIDPKNKITFDEKNWESDAHPLGVSKKHSSIDSATSRVVSWAVDLVVDVWYRPKSTKLFYNESDFQRFRITQQQAEEGRQSQEGETSTLKYGAMNIRRRSSFRRDCG